MIEHKRLKRLFDSQNFKPAQGLLLKPYHQFGPGRPFHNPVAAVKAMMLQRLGGILWSGPWLRGWPGAESTGGFVGLAAAHKAGMLQPP
jgi:hypothetical protein